MDALVALTVRVLVVPQLVVQEAGGVVVGVRVATGAGVRIGAGVGVAAGVGVGAGSAGVEGDTVTATALERATSE